MSTIPRRLYRSRRERIIAGVGGGLGEYFDVDPTIVRLLFVLATVLGGIGVIVYIVLWLIMPREDEIIGHPATTESTPGEEPTDVTGLSDEERQRARVRRQGMGGLVLIVLGLLFLAQNFDLLWWFNWRLFWPMVLIAAGALLLARRWRQW
jgi:phage shock protein PspC (stress-responsive transcriptional regulator)